MSKSARITSTPGSSGSSKVLSAAVAISAVESTSEKSSEKMSEEERRIAGLFEVTMTSLGIIASGVVTGWNGAIEMGIGEYMISLAICTIGYGCLTLCIAEMAGIIAFSGGSFGYARCTLSPFIGYLVGMCDLLQCVLFTSCSVYSVSRALNIAATDDPTGPYLPLWWIAIYTLAIVIMLPGGRWMWNSIAAFTILTLLMFLMYGLGVIDHMNYPYWSTKEIPAFNSGSHLFMENLIVPTICYIGIDLTTIFGDETKEPQRNIPYGMIIAFGVTVIIAWWVTITAVSIAPGVSNEFMDEKIVFPMHFGFEQMFGFADQAANCLMAPTLLSSVMGFMFASGRQMYSMSKSGLLPAWLCKTVGKRKVPLVAMITTAVIGIIVLLPVWGLNPNADDLYELCIIGACCVYISMFWCYIVFKLRFGAMDRTFTNPLGIMSAIYGIIYFGLVLTTLLFAQLDFNALCAFAPYMLLAVLYYYQVVEARQFFSKDEQQKFMKAYIMNANRRRKKAGPQSPFQKAVIRVVKAMLPQDSQTINNSSSKSSVTIGSQSPRSVGSKVMNSKDAMMELQEHDVSVIAVSNSTNKIVPVRSHDEKNIDVLEEQREAEEIS